MTFMTGDIHGNQLLWETHISPLLSNGDTVIIAGDFGIGFFDGPHWSEEMFLDYLSNQDIQILFCDGNHENFDILNSFDISEWNGGQVHFIRRNIIHLMRGEIYEISGKSLFVMGGGYSIDKNHRVLGKNWWPDEMPCGSEYENAINNLKRNRYKVDYILSHTGPSDTVEYITHLCVGITGPFKEEAPLNGFLKYITELVEYKKYYFGHFHIDAELWHSQFAVYNALRDLETGDLIKMRG